MEPLTAKKFENAPLDALMCPLQINDIEPLSPTLHGVNAHFIHHLFNVEITGLVMSWKLLNQNKRFLENIFYTFLPILGSKFKIPITTEIQELF